MSGTGYDLSTTTFSPDGRVFQVEYAYKAIEKSGLAIGIKCIDGVILGVEKLNISKLLVNGSNKRTFICDYHVGMTLSGLAADARQLANKTQEEAQKYRSFYGNAIPGSVLIDRMANHVHSHTLYWYLRPYGASVLFASYDEEGPQLFQVDPNGVSNKFFAAAIGKNKSGAKGELEKIDFTTITVREAIKIVAKILYKLHDDVKDKQMELELSWICDESNRKFCFVPSTVRAEAIQYAIDAKRREEMDEDDDEVALLAV